MDWLCALARAGRQLWTWPPTPRARERGIVEAARREEIAREIEFGPLAEGDVAGISELITGMSYAEGDQRLRDKSPAYYRWMYLENPAGQAIVHSARHRGRIVASFALAPKTVQIDGRRLVVGKTMDMFTDPDYQGMGLIKRCTEAVFAEAKASGMAGWYVTPSVNSDPIFTGKWGYREDFTLAYRARVLAYAPVLAAAVKPAGPARLAGRVLDGIRGILPRRRLRLPAGCSVATMASFGPETDQLWSDVATGYRVALVRDAAYLTWRYIDNPDDYTVLGLSREGRLIGLVVLTETLRRGVPVGEIVDYVCGADDTGTFQLLVDAALEHAREQGQALVQAWSVPGTPLDARLRAAGLPWRRADVKFLISPGFPDEVIYDGASWLLTQGDGNDV